MDTTTTNKSARVSIILVTWNAAAYIRHTIRSIQEQTYDDFDVLVIDNGSTDDTVAIIRDQFGDLVRVVEHNKNSGFSKAYNLGIHWTRGEYVLVMNQDVVLDPEYLEQVVVFLDHHDKVGAVQGKVLHWNITQNKRESIIDTCGIDIYKNHACRNRFEGIAEQEITEDDSALPVFAFSGSCVALRRSALQDVQYKQEFFDEDFFAYKEDIDLSWRLRHAHWDIVYVPTARSYHGRTLTLSGAYSRRNIISQRKNQDAFLHQLSYQNHLLLLFKNQYLKNFIKYFFSVFWFEFQKMGYILIFEQSSLRGLWGVIRLVPKMYKKRKKILQHSKMKAEDFQSWVQRT